MTVTKKELNKEFKAAWLRFNANLSALWVFSQEIDALAEQWDNQLIQQLAIDLADVFDDDPGEIEKGLREFVPSVSELEIEPNYLENATVREIINTFQTGEFQRRVLRWVGRQPQKGYKFIEIINQAFNQPPANSILLRRSALVSLVGFLEILIRDLFAIYYTHVESAGAASQQAPISFDKKMENAMQGGLTGRIETFQKLGLDTTIIDGIKEELKEIIKRRNLIVHQDGVMDSAYVKTPATFKKGYKAGQRILVPNSYLLESLAQVHSFGAGLHQLCWREWASNPQKEADRSFENFVFFSLQKERYSMTFKLVELGGEFGMDKTARLVNQVNHAIAWREQGNEAQVQQLVRELKFSRPNWKIKIAIAVLQGDEFQARSLLTQAAQRRKLKEIYPDWPLFWPIKDYAWFQNVFKLDQSALRQKKR